jgi:hypothetical protein
MDEKTFYQDSDVMVTQSRFIVGGKTYAMRNISSVHVGKIEPSRVGAGLLLLFGMLLCFSDSSRAVGIVLVVLSAVWLFLLKNKYAVRISSNSGEANSLVSKNQSYISQIVAAVNDAMVYKG